MKKNRIIIIGGVAGGATAAARIRRLDEHASITVYERTSYISYANCGLPYYIGGVITDRNALTLQTPQSFYSRFRVDMKVRHEVLAIHPETKSVTVKNLTTDEVFEDFYDKLLLAPGAIPILPAINKKNGADAHTELASAANLFVLRTVEDTFRIHTYIEETHPKTVVLAGGGFIGLELAENLSRQEIDVTIVQKPNHLMNPFDADMASFLHARIRKAGVHLILGQSVENVSTEEKSGCVSDSDSASNSHSSRITVTLSDQSTLTADFAVFAIGVKPETTLAKAAGLTLGLRDSIVVNDHMETSIPNIYAVGDAVSVKHLVSEKSVLLPLAGPANKQGRIAADNICGGDRAFRGSLGSSVIKLFDMTAAVTGLNETAAKNAGISFDEVILSPSNHAGYYPGGHVMTMKILFEKETYRLLGAQIVGFEGVDKRIDVLATAICAGMRADELMDLDLSYAPPYSSAKDPINMAGFMIDNIKHGVVKQFFVDDAAVLPQDGSVTLLDTRTAVEYSRGHAEGFVNIPVDELRDHISELDSTKPIYIMCQSGLRSYIATRILSGYGFDCYNFAGGYRFYESVMTERTQSKTVLACGAEQL